MLFNSYEFIFAFLPIALIGLGILIGYRQKLTAKIWLLSASLFFYAYWNPPYLLLLLVSIGANYVLGGWIERAEPNSGRAKGILIGGICLNLVLIGYYKYANFFADSVNFLIGTEWGFGDIILPLGISFYTFTQIAYLVDAYRGETRDSRYDLLSYTLFIVFFPQLIAGPILRHNELIPRLDNAKILSESFASGIVLFTLGLAKKVLIADRLSPTVAAVFSDPSNVSFIDAWVGALSYTFQLYFDFSGYSDMAIGLGLMMNVEIPINFNSPYKATSISDFWRRWHITLSNFLRDYLYIPLGGNRKGQARQYGNLLTTMLLGGLWHGAGWTYVLWGGFHGLLLIVNHWWRKLGISMPNVLAWAMTFGAVLISWVFFRAYNVQDGFSLVSTMLGLQGFDLSQQDSSRRDLLVLAGLLICVTCLPNTQQILQRFKPTLPWMVAVSGLAIVSLLSLNRLTEFLYFQF